MDIFQYALKREQDSEAYYRELAAGCPDSNLQAILRRLAESEVRHQHIIQKMKEKARARVEGDPFLSDVRGSFVVIRERGSNVERGTSQVDFYLKAQEFEKESWDMYLKAAEEARTDAARVVLHRLAAQEKVHYQILGTIIELVSHPMLGNWLEDAEWYHLDGY